MRQADLCLFSSALTALAASLRGAFPIAGKVSAAASLAAAVAATSTVAMLAALAAGFCGKLTVLRKAALVVGHILAALAGDIALPVFVHVRESAILICHR